MSSLRTLFLSGSQYVVDVTRVCRTRSASRLSRPGAGYPRSEGSGAKFVIYLGIATAARALRAELEDIQTQLRHHTLRSSLPLSGGRIIGLGLATALKHTYTLQHNPTAATWLSTRYMYMYYDTFARPSVRPSIDRRPATHQRAATTWRPLVVLTC